MHGYDVIDHGMLNPELGTREDFDAMVAQLQQHGMGLVVDIVPNHMGVLSGDNAWWLDVLENGAAAEHAGFFDIDWNAADPALTGRVLLPILGDQYGVVLERGEIALAFEREHGAFTLSYFEHKLPVDPGCYGRLLRETLGSSGTEGADAALQSLADAFDRLPPHSSTDPSATALRQREQTALKQQLAQLVGQHAALVDAIDAMVGKLNGSPGERASYDALDALIEAQPYRLAHWRIAGDEINYRRFFDINELAALRMEEPPCLRCDARADLRSGRRRRDQRLAHRPPGRSGRSGALFPSTCSSAMQSASACQRRRRAAPRKRPRRRCSSRSRRSSRRTSSCRATGRCTAPPATASPTSSTAC